MPKVFTCTHVCVHMRACAHTRSEGERESKIKNHDILFLLIGNPLF